LINEYVGEVIDYKEMCNRLRKKEYANLNYLVQLNSDEIIDSTSKGNLTRFINHSCDPNSVGEKVRFEVCNLYSVSLFIKIAL
jgi:SET domain-containing protein